MSPMTRFSYSWKLHQSEDIFRTGVSLHGHTWNSHESLSFLPGITHHTFPLRQIMQWVERRYEQKWHQPFDYSKGYWTSPISPQAAYDIEAGQIKKHRLSPLVSLTDHDEISACEELGSIVPVSVEWTAPYKSAVLHIGVHNLPASVGRKILQQLHKYTAHPTPNVLNELLSDINNFPESLVILNHPLSDQGRIGYEIHGSLVKDFLKTNHGLIHALEVNALQSWDINRRVARIADQALLPLISGGDRHAFEPNGAINLTDAKTFSEFVHEIREEKKSEVLFMPQCRRSLFQRYGENVARILSDYPELPGREFWYDRIFYQCPDGITRRLSEMFNIHNGAVKTTDFFIGTLGLATHISPPISAIFAESNKSMNS